MCGSAIYPFRRTVIGGIKTTGLVWGGEFVRQAVAEEYNDFIYFKP